MQFSKTDKNQVSRLAKRASYDSDVLFPILDEALFATIAFSKDGQPFQIPTGFVRIGNELFVHGSVGSHFLRELVKGIPVCISVMIADALVLARSAFHHSVNYRSAVIFSHAREEKGDAQRDAALAAFTEKLLPGRWDDIRKPNAGEWKKTMVLAFPIEEASAKVRTGPPLDDEEDMDLDVWAGLLPIRKGFGKPEAAPDLKTGLGVPGYLKF